MQKDLNQEVYNLQEACEFTRLSASLLRKAVADGKLKCARSNGESGKMIFRKEYLLDWVFGENDAE